MPLNDGAINEILLFASEATEASGDLMTLDDYGSSPDRLRGHQAGLAKRALENRVLRQTTLMAVGLAQFIANRDGAGVRDNADADAIEEGLAATIDAMIALTNTYDIPFMAGWGGDFGGEDLTAQGYGAVVLARDITILGEVGKVGVAPTGAAITFDIEKNGASIYTAPPQIAAGATVLTAGVLDPAQAICSAGDVLVFKLTQVGTATKGQKATFTIRGQVR